MKETGVKIHVPPPSVNRDEITIAGDKEGVQSAIEKIKEVYAKMVSYNIIQNIKRSYNFYNEQGVSREFTHCDIS